MSPAPVTPSALDRSTYAAASPAGDSFYVEPPSVPPGLTIGEYRRRRSDKDPNPRALGRAERLRLKPAARRHPIAFALLLTR
jgi:hypothetical protein